MSWAKMTLLTFAWWQANQVSWWEPQLYALTPQDLQLAEEEESPTALNFSFQEEFLGLLHLGCLRAFSHP